MAYVNGRKNLDWPTTTQSTTQSTRVTRMVELLDQYETEHGVDALQREQDDILCTQRKYMVVGNVNCESLGNNLGMYLHGIVMALLLNRTVVIRDNNRCHQLLQYKEWVPTVASVETRLSPHCLNVSFRNPPSPPYACYIDQSNLTVMTYTALQNRAFDHFNHLSGALFGPEMQRRRDVLFSCPVFENGRFEIYGMIIDKFLSFSEVVQDYVAADMTAVEEYEQECSGSASSTHARAGAGAGDKGNEGKGGRGRSESVPFYRIGVHVRHR